MRIAQVAPLSESVPPKQYGGTERIVSYLTEELVRQGHDVTLFASGDSATRARLVAACRRSLRWNDRCIDWMAHHVLMLEQVFQRAHEFDVVHFHIDYLHFPLSRRASVPHVTTLHGRLDLPDLVSLRATLNMIEAEGPASAADVADISFQAALRERDPAGAVRALANIPSEGYRKEADYPVPRAWHEGLVAKLRQDAPAAHAAFMVARVETEKLVRAQPENVKPLSALAFVDAELGDKEKAIREGRTACDMVPVAKDAFDGVLLVNNLARVYSLTGEKDLAIKQLEIVSKIPCGPSYGELRLDPEWDSLRGDPRFEKIVASLAPKPADK